MSFSTKYLISSKNTGLVILMLPCSVPYCQLVTPCWSICTRLSLRIRLTHHPFSTYASLFPSLASELSVPSAPPRLFPGYRRTACLPLSSLKSKTRWWQGAEITRQFSGQTQLQNGFPRVGSRLAQAGE